MRRSLAAIVVLAGLLTAPAAEAQAPTLTVMGPARQHLPNALRLVVGSSGLAYTQVHAAIPGISYLGRPARFKTQIDFTGGYAGRVVIRMEPKMLGYVAKRLPKRGVLVRPMVSDALSGASVVGAPIRLLP